MRGQNRRSQRWTALVVALVTIGMMPTAVDAGGNHGGGYGGGYGGEHSSCSLYPIGVKASLVDGKPEGTKINDLTIGAPSGHQGWLTWKGDVSESALARVVQRRR